MRMSRGRSDVFKFPLSCKLVKFLITKNYQSFEEAVFNSRCTHIWQWATIFIWCGFTQLGKVRIVVDNNHNIIIFTIKRKQVCAKFGPGSSWGFSSSWHCSSLKMLQTEHWAMWSLISEFIKLALRRDPSIPMWLLCTLWMNDLLL